MVYLTVTLAGRICAMFALQDCDVDVFAIFNTFEIPFTYLLADIFMGRIPDYLGAVGSALIFMSLLALTMNDFYGGDSKDSKDQSPEGDLHDRADAKWIVIRGLLRGHDDMPRG
jgi:drug/metabolite transporter (DMT)-like permease